MGRSAHYLVPVILFIDATHCDTKGSLQAEPVLCTIGNIALEHRKRPIAWFFLGLMPRKVLTAMECNERMRRHSGRSKLVQQYQACLHKIMSELMHLQLEDAMNGLGVRAYLHGKGNVFLHFELALVIGDTIAHDTTICGHYCLYSNMIQRPIRSCNVS